MKTTHTPGPWTQSKRNEADVYSENGERIASAHGPRCADNARLIAAAPDLLAALERIMNAADHGTVKMRSELGIQASAAIAKAKGAQ